MNQDELERQRRATTLAKTARPFRPTSRTPDSAPRRYSRHARSAKRHGAAVLADCPSMKGKLSAWLVLRLFSMKRTVDDLSGCWRGRGSWSSFARRRPPMEARASADPRRRGGRSCHGLGLAGAPEGEG